MNFSFDVALCEKDYLYFNVYTLKVYGIFKKQVLFLRILFAIALIGMSVYEIFRFEDLISSIVFSAIMLIILIPAEIFVPKYLAFFTRLQVKSIIKKGKALYSKSSKMEFSEQFFTETTDTARVEQKYSSVEKISYSEEMKTVYLHINKMMAYIIPTASFDSPEETVRFLKFIKEKCTDAECLF